MYCAGGRHITNRIKTEMHAFWNVMEWLANTILFVWVGIALAFVLLEPSSPQLKSEVKFSHHLSPVDAGYAVVLYLWLLVSPSLFHFILAEAKTQSLGTSMLWGVSSCS
jgi:NhaP-type Na+/H+ or K+/H+ antiporter